MKCRDQGGQATRDQGETRDKGHRGTQGGQRDKGQRVLDT